LTEVKDFCVFYWRLKKITFVPYHVIRPSVRGLVSATKPLLSSVKKRNLNMSQLRINFDLEDAHRMC